MHLQISLSLQTRPFRHWAHSGPFLVLVQLSYLLMPNLHMLLLTEALVRAGSIGPLRPVLLAGAQNLVRSAALIQRRPMLSTQQVDQ